MVDEKPRLMTVFSAASELDSAEDRAAFLTAMCGADADLRARVEALLRAHERAGVFLEPGPGPRPEVAPAGTALGPYRLLRPIGEGGMGTVYMAEQERPVRRRVALKVIKAGMDTAQVIARFEAERQALALMDHPNIARVHDAGTTDAGRPFFVMELVDGIAITAYCDRERLAIGERLGLFIPVCRAVQHAHLKGVIHRDLKPSNILVSLHDGVPIPKIIDFGIAKATNARLTEKSIFTEFGSVVGTPEYMSPEQAELHQLDVDTRSDVYSLGVLLFELLTGTTPLRGEQLKEVPLLEMLRLIREAEPPRPSARLGTTDELPTIAARRDAEARKLVAAVRGELDWIAVKALEKDRSRRYETAGSLAADVQRYLDGQPVEACPPSAWYRLRKAARRNRGLLTTCAVVSLALLSATGLSLRLMARARDAESRAQGDFRQARDAVDRVLLRVPDELADVPGTAEVRRMILNDALEFYQGFLAAHADDPEVIFDAARAEHRVAAIHQLLGNRDRVEAPLGRAIPRLRDLVDAFPDVEAYRVELANSHNRLAEVLDDGFSKTRAIAERRVALAHLEVLAAAHPDDPSYRRRLAGLHCNLGISLSTDRTPDFDEAEEHLLAALAIWDRARETFPGLPENRAELARLHLWHGNLLGQTAREDAAEHAYRLALTLLDEALAEDPASPMLAARQAQVKMYLANLILPRGQRAEAERLLREAAAQIEPLWLAFPEIHEHPKQLALIDRYLAFSLWETGRLPEARETLLMALGVREEAARAHDRSPGHLEGVATILCELGLLLEDCGESRAAADAFRRALAIFGERAVRDPDIGRLQVELAWWLSVCPTPSLRDPARAARLATRGVALSPDVAIAWRVLGVARYRSGDLAAANAALDRALELDPDDRAAALFLAMIAARRGDAAEARLWHARGVESPASWLPTERLNRRFAAEAAALIPSGGPPGG